MFDQKYLVALFFFFISYILTSSNKERLSVSILFFFIPFLAAPFKEASFFFILGLNSFMIWGIWLAHITASNSIYKFNYSWNIYSNKISILYYFLFGGIILVLINPNLDKILFAYHEPISSTVNFSLYLVTLVIFLKIMINYQFDYLFHDKLKAIFIATSLLQVSIFIISLTSLGRYLPNYLITTQEIHTSKFRYAGLLGDYELIVDYIMIVIAFCIIFLLRKKYLILSYCGIASSISLGILSGTRSFIIIIILFLFFLFILLSFQNHFKIVLRNIVIIIFILIVWNVAKENLSSYTNIFDRFTDTKQLYFSGGNIEDISNRNFSQSIPNILEKSSILGNGSLLISAIDDDPMVSHNLFLAMYGNYGLVGIFFIFFLFLSTLKNLFKVTIHAKTNLIKLESIVYFSLLLSLFLNEFKISAIRNISSILTYAVLFVFIKFLLIKNSNYVPT